MSNYACIDENNYSHDIYGSCESSNINNTDIVGISNNSYASSINNHNIQGEYDKYNTTTKHIPPSEIQKITTAQPKCNNPKNIIIKQSEIRSKMKKITNNYFTGNFLDYHGIGNKH